MKSLGIITVGSLICINAFAATTNYTITPIGLADAEHTSSSGYQFSEALQQNSSGQAIGEAKIYGGGASATGESLWFYNGATTTNIGFTDTEHTRDTNGYRRVGNGMLNDAGQVVGQSWRFAAGGDDLGTSAWFFDGSSTINIGLTGSAYTRDYDGYRKSGIYGLNSAGNVAGASTLYGSEYTNLGQTAWLYKAGSNIEIGFTDAEHTRDTTGYRSSSPKILNEAGQVAGTSNRFRTGGANNGRTAWLYDGTSTIKLGFTDTLHTRAADGMRESGIADMNESGQAVGSSVRYTTPPLGSANSSAWIYDGTSTIEIGLLDAEHTDAIGDRRTNGAGQINEAGQVLGGAGRYAADGSSLGTSTWRYSGGATTKIGLTGSEHTRDTDGYQRNYGGHLNEAGQVAGSARRYGAGGTEIGNSAWLFDGIVTVSIGMTEVANIRQTDGFSWNQVELFNEAGQATGYSGLYGAGGTDMGSMAWLYDGSTTIGLEALDQRSDGYSFSRINWLGEDGTALGYYYDYEIIDIFGAPTETYRSKAFYYTEEGGMFDLDLIITDGFDDWSSLSEALGLSDNGVFIGTGSLASQGTAMAYALTPTAVPVPAAVWLFGSGLGLLGFIRRKQLSPGASH